MSDNKQFNNIYIDNSEMVKIYDAYSNKGYEEGYKNGEKYGIIKCANMIKETCKIVGVVYPEDIDDIVNLLLNGGIQNGNE